MSEINDFNETVSGKDREKIKKMDTIATYQEADHRIKEKVQTCVLASWLAYLQEGWSQRARHERGAVQLVLAHGSPGGWHP